MKRSVKHLIKKVKNEGYSCFSPSCVNCSRPYNVLSNVNNIWQACDIARIILHDSSDKSSIFSMQVYEAKRNLLAASIMFYKKRFPRYATLPNVLAFLFQPIDNILEVLYTESSIVPFINATVMYYQNKDWESYAAIFDSSVYAPFFTNDMCYLLGKDEKSTWNFRPCCFSADADSSVSLKKFHETVNELVKRDLGDDYIELPGNLVFCDPVEQRKYLSPFFFVSHEFGSNYTELLFAQAKEAVDRVLHPSVYENEMEDILRGVYHYMDDSDHIEIAQPTVELAEQEETEGLSEIEKSQEERLHGIETEEPEF